MGKGLGKREETSSNKTSASTSIHTYKEFFFCPKKKKEKSAPMKINMPSSEEMITIMTHDYSHATSRGE